ncbi:hypothetical protein [Aeromonas dhakensis]|uniref:hypothetical protein n=1 Tax=Aeromonas dhakensis TaxID=196024 RepID=UPI003BA18428
MQLAAYSSGQTEQTQQRSNAATQQRSNAATQQRSNAATQQLHSPRSTLMPCKKLLILILNGGMILLL